MKKLWCILLLLFLPLAASAEEYHYTLSNGRRCQAVTFAAQVPEPLAGALADSQFAEDELLCGVLLTHMRENPVRVESRQALVALRHGEKTLLLWCSRSSETGWKLAVAAEDFLRADQPFTIEAVAEGDVGFYPQPNATYGYIREKDAIQYECLMEMKYAP